MDMGKENFYILLELPFDPPVTDAGEIRDALHKKKQQWTRWQDNPSKRAAALKYLDMASGIEEVMLDPARRGQQAEEALSLKKKVMRQFEAELRILEDKGYLLPREVTSLTVRYKAYGITRDDVLFHARCPVSDTPPIRDPSREEEKELPDEVTTRTIRRDLEVLGLSSLYEFLDEQPYASIKKLQEAAEAKRKAAQSSPSKNAEASATQELAGLCVEMFADFDAKQRYDRYLKISKYPGLGELLQEERHRSGYISPSILLRMVNYAVEKYGVGVLEAEEYIRRYCAAYDILVGEKRPRITCPACGKETGQASAVCPACAQPLRGECPGCGAAFEDGAAVCAECGFALADMVKALRHLDDAQDAVIENNWGTAQRNVQYARKYWPGHPQIEPLEKRAASLEDTYARYVDNINDCIRHNQYYAAQELVDEAQARRIRLPRAMTDRVRSTLEEFEGKLDILMRKRDLTVEQVLDLAALVGDSIELSRMMKKHPPEAPATLHAALNGRSALLQWPRSVAPGILDYALVRKRGSAPLTAFDGDILYEGPGLSFEDRRAEILCEQYYAVFTRRNGSYSPQGVSAGPVLIIPELEELRILPSDQGAQISWKYNPQINDVTIWRKLGGERPAAQGEGIRLEANRVDGFTDSRIKNDVEYWYYLVASYVADGRKVYSRGVCDSVIPHKFMAPVENLLVTRSDGDENEYVVNWQNEQHSDILLMVSTKKPELRAGEILPVQDLLTRYRRLELKPRGAGSGVFEYSLNGGVYVFVAAVFGRFASVSQSFYLTNVKNVEELTCDVLEGDLYLNMKWPAGLQEIEVAYRLDRFPESPEEVGTPVTVVTREQYDYDAAVIIREPERMNYFIRVYSVFVTPEGTRVRSEGVDITVDNTALQEVFYDISMKKKMFARMSTVTLSVSSQEPFVLPRSVLVGKIGRLPLCKTDGISLFEIERDTKVDGEILFEYQTAGLPDDLYIRLFLHDDSMYAAYRLLPQGSIRLTWKGGNR